eukprot:TRINITY_DN883_c0_g1_i5.p1 TRINITY_DN883_c0_g1~~TRINITY_DN883_c0_g1_i5.p1  ORF type:complete len:1128 (-),score=181.00 TRINITY_DN883_c0_g1_i5:114-3497(-)
MFQAIVFGKICVKPRVPALLGIGGCGKTHVLRRLHRYIASATGEYQLVPLYLTFNSITQFCEDETDMDLAVARRIFYDLFGTLGDLTQMTSVLEKVLQSRGHHGRVTARIALEIWFEQRLLMAPEAERKGKFLILLGIDEITRISDASLLESLLTIVTGLSDQVRYFGTKDVRILPVVAGVRPTAVTAALRSGSQRDVQSLGVTLLSNEEMLQFVSKELVRQDWQTNTELRLGLLLCFGHFRSLSILLAAWRQKRPDLLSVLSNDFCLYVNNNTFKPEHVARVLLDVPLDASDIDFMQFNGFIHSLQSRGSTTVDVVVPPLVIVHCSPVDDPTGGVGLYQSCLRLHNTSSGENWEEVVANAVVMRVRCLFLIGKSEATLSDLFGGKVACDDDEPTFDISTCSRIQAIRVQGNVSLSEMAKDVTTAPAVYFKAAAGTTGAIDILIVTKTTTKRIAWGTRIAVQCKFSAASSGVPNMTSDLIRKADNRIRADGLAYIRTVIISQYPRVTFDELPSRSAVVDLEACHLFFTKTFSSLVQACASVNVNWCSRSRLSSIFESDAAATAIIKRRTVVPFRTRAEFLLWASNKKVDKLATGAAAVALGTAVAPLAYVTFEADDFAADDFAAENAENAPADAASKPMTKMSPEARMLCERAKRLRGGELTMPVVFSPMAGPFPHVSLKNVYQTTCHTIAVIQALYSTSLIRDIMERDCKNLRDQFIKEADATLDKLVDGIAQLLKCHSSLSAVKFQLDAMPRSDVLAALPKPGGTGLDAQMLVKFQELLKEKDASAADCVAALSECCAIAGATVHGAYVLLESLKRLFYQMLHGDVSEDAILDVLALTFAQRPQLDITRHQDAEEVAWTPLAEALSLFELLPRIKYKSERTCTVCSIAGSPIEETLLALARPIPVNRETICDTLSAEKIAALKTTLAEHSNILRFLGLADMDIRDPFVFDDETCVVEKSCDNCLVPTAKATERVAVDLPAVFCVQLQRFSLNGKITTPIKIPRQIHSAYLVAVIEHIGATLDGGHYICYCVRDKIWYCFNDDQPVLQRAPNLDSNRNAYLCVFDQHTEGAAPTVAVDDSIQDLSEESMEGDNEDPTSKPPSAASRKRQASPQGLWGKRVKSDVET